MTDDNRLNARTRILKKEATESLCGYFPKPQAEWIVDVLAYYVSEQFKVRAEIERSDT
ncbi:MAG TPA: hypothetical protein VGU20_30930 [Stellaceae bacterium]|nr:hypothetical protein [Terriglobia bacterium]HEV2551765.1 hypothetical protein [Stellaceae bacterium]